MAIRLLTKSNTQQPTSPDPTLVYMDVTIPQHFNIPEPNIVDDDDYPIPVSRYTGKFNGNTFGSNDYIVSTDGPYIVNQPDSDSGVLHIVFVNPWETDNYVVLSYPLPDGLDFNVDYITKRHHGGVPDLPTDATIGQRCFALRRVKYSNNASSNFSITVGSAGPSSAIYELTDTGWVVDQIIDARASVYPRAPFVLDKTQPIYAVVSEDALSVHMFNNDAVVEWKRTFVNPVGPYGKVYTPRVQGIDNGNVMLASLGEDMYDVSDEPPWIYDNTTALRWVNSPFGVRLAAMKYHDSTDGAIPLFQTDINGTPIDQYVHNISSPISDLMPSIGGGPIDLGLTNNKIRIKYRTSLPLAPKDDTLFLVKEKENEELALIMTIGNELVRIRPSDVYKIAGTLDSASMFIHNTVTSYSFIEDKLAYAIFNNDFTREIVFSKEGESDITVKYET